MPWFGLAATHTPRELRALGQRILDVIAPHIADEILSHQLERDHDQALRDCHLSLTDDDEGRTHLRGVVPASVGAMMRRNLRAFIAPKHVRATSNGDPEQCEILRKPSPDRWGQALCEWVERYPVNALPSSGGVQARAMVTIDHHQLADTLHASGVATIDGTLIPASEARRLACEAGILPHVLNGQSTPLDLGRSKRFHTTARRLVMDHRDKTCTTEGCDWPAHLSHAHHETPGSQSGNTTVDTARILCPHHHQLAHHRRWQMNKTKHGRVIFIRR